MRTHLSMNPFETTIVNVFDISTKKIVFTGSQANAAIFLRCHPTTVCSAVKYKRKIKGKKYAIRYAHNTEL